VEKKIAEHHKKLRKEAKKNPNKRSKLKKDPGIPNLWPFKEELMDQIQTDKIRAEEEKRLAKMEAKDQLAELRRRAEAAEGDYEDRQHDINEEAHYQDSSRRTFFREFKKVVKAADVIIQVLDARDPLGTRCQEIERQILETDPKKKIVLVLNKIDLVSRQNLEDWLKVLRRELPTVAFKASTQQQRSHMGHHSHSVKSSKKGGAGDVEHVTECLGASTLLGLLKNYARSRNMKMSITVGIIGIPNVGKSSLINSLKRERAVGVGATPGLTRSMQEVVLDKNVKLLDCPGIVFTSATSEAEAALRNAVKVEQLLDVIAPVELILSKCSAAQLMEIYHIGEFSNVVEFLTAVAKKRGKIKSGGVVDIDSAAKVVIGDWNGGKIPYMSRPPKDHSQLGAEIVPAWSEEFNIAAIEALEAEHVLQQVPDAPSVQFVELPPSTALRADAIMMSEDGVVQEDSDDEDDGAMDADEPEENQEDSDADNSSKMDVVKTRAPKSSKDLKTASKKRSKLEKKRKRAEVANNDDMDASDEDDTYDFGADFWARVPASQVRGDAKASSSAPDYSDFAM
jgi:nuclear GTP-binding protein